MMKTNRTYRRGTTYPDCAAAIQKGVAEYGDGHEIRGYLIEVIEVLQCDSGRAVRCSQRPPIHTNDRYQNDEDERGYTHEWL